MCLLAGSASSAAKEALRHGLVGEGSIQSLLYLRSLALASTFLPLASLLVCPFLTLRLCFASSLSYLLCYVQHPRLHRGAIDYTIRAAPTTNSQQPCKHSSEMAALQKTPSKNLGPDYRPKEEKPQATVSTPVSHENIHILPQTPQLISLLTYELPGICNLHVLSATLTPWQYDPR